MSELENENLKRLQDIPNLKLFKYPHHGKGLNKFVFKFDSPTKKHAEGSINIEGNIITARIFYTDYNPKYLYRKLNSSFHNHGFNKKNLNLSFTQNDIHEGSILIIKSVIRNPSPGLMIDLDESYLFYSLDNSAIECSGIPVGHFMQVEFLEKFTSTCLSDSGENPEEPIEYFKVEVYKIYW